MAREKTARTDTKRKSEVVTVRLDPKLKYLAELAARRQRRPLSSYIEWAIEESLAKVNPDYDPSRTQYPDTLKDVANDLWDVDEPDRFIKLALRYPYLLDHEEQRLWKLIRENGSVWYGRFAGIGNYWVWDIDEHSMNWECLREHWETFNRVATGEWDESALPDWDRQKTSQIPNGDDLDDEIPF